MTTTQTFLSRTEEYRLFASTWEGLPDAGQAREQLITSNMQCVRNFILKHPATSWYDREDALQEAYVVLAESLDQVPVGIATPGAYLYKVACNRVRNLFRSTNTVASMDAALSDREHFTLHDVLAAAGPNFSVDPRSDPRIRALHKALHRLPLHMQQAVQELYGLSCFHTSVKKHVPGVKRIHALTSFGLETRRSLAYSALRQDKHLYQQVIQRSASEVQA